MDHGTTLDTRPTLFRMPQTLTLPLLAVLAAAVATQQAPTRFAAAAETAPDEATVGTRSRPFRRAITTILKVDRLGKGNRDAAAAARVLSAAPVDVLPEVLKAMNAANDLARNWLRGVAEAIADKALSEKRPLPKQWLEEFVTDRRNHPRARHLAFELLLRVDPTARERLIPGMIDDPAPEFRREAVARLIAQADHALQAGQTEKAKQQLERALQAATDKDQVEAIVKRLKPLGRTVNLQRHFGFITQWYMIGPFDNRGGVGFAAEYPPERRVDLNAKLNGQLGPVKWTLVRTDDDYGLLDITRLFQNYKGSVMYAYTEFYSPREQDVEFRLATPNAWKLWLNGELLFGREEYHRGTRMDQYRVPARLRRGKNTILLKICQNEQTQDWAQRYQFQFRVVDPTGRAVLSQPPADVSLRRR